MKGNSNLHKAKQTKNDEFYTLLCDVEKELENYIEYFKDKVIYCNCDTTSSSFWQYFYTNFSRLGLKKLVCTAYNENGAGQKSEYIGKDSKIVMQDLSGNGDFRSNECLEILEEADIVVTNPPFSLFRDFIHVLDTYRTDFIIIGNTNAVVYAEVFELFKENRVRTGYTNFNIGMYFEVPRDYEYTKIIDGKRCARVSTSCWYTTLPVKKHDKILKLNQHYSAEKYPEYHNYKAIHVANISDIPVDYDGIMGVPLTFLDKYNPEQFQIVGLSSGKHNKDIPRKHDNEFYNGYTRGRVRTRIDSNLPILDLSGWGGTKCVRDNSSNMFQLYWRVFVRKK